ncbi:hypothetical protein ACFSX9_04205 [Flavobacterium ardleyense]|uniref:Uncharacterized protein n=1 Tax=Flavobacterium ardleyense TaxID=2038737 RepID=A0ABW5Z5V2_9FLAO
MKTKFLKIGMSLAVFALAIMGAYASQNTDNLVLAPQTGWIDTPSPCEIPVSCSTEFGPLCTMVYQGEVKQAFGKDNLNDATCAKELYRIH